MAKRERAQKLTQTAVERAPPEAERYTIADSEIAGFKLVVYPSGRKAFYYRYRVGGGRSATIREPKIGDAPPMKAERARAIAAEWAAQVRLGGDPGGQRKEQRLAPTMTDLFERYLADHAAAHKKASSANNDRRLIEKRLLKAFGTRKVADVTRAEIARFHASLRCTPYEANRALALLSKAFNLAEVWGWRTNASNPCRQVGKFAEAKRKRWLSNEELARLGDVLRQAERHGCVASPAGRPTPISVYAIAAVRLLLLTGARKGEILGLQWAWIDFERGRANLPDSKTGDKPIMLPPAALEILEALPRVEGNPHVIVGGKKGAALVNLKDPWLAIREAAGLSGVRVHDLRHSFASVAVSGGASLPVVGALLGHSQPSTTARYSHLADDPLRAAAAEVGGRIMAAMGNSPRGT